MKYSVIIPTLNEEKYISGILISLSIQDEKDFEIIVVDCKSKDRTKDLVSNFQRRIKNLFFYTINKKNVSAQRNYGAKKAKGDILIFFDADITIKKDFFLALKKHLKKSCALANINVLNPRFKDKIFSVCVNRWIKLLNYLNIGAGRGGLIIISKKLFDLTGGFNEDIIVAEDIEFLKRVKKHSKIQFIDSITVFENKRRFLKDGYLKTFFTWTVNGLYFRIFNKSYTKYNDVR